MKSCGDHLKGATVFAILCVSCLGVLANGSASAQSQIFVEAGATGLNDGTSWTNGYRDLSDALDQAALTASAVNPVQIWIARGLYTPGRGSLDPTVTFTVVDGVQLYGGFAGGETELSQRDPILNETILSGDLGRNDDVFGCDPASNCCYEHYGFGCDDDACEAVVCAHYAYSYCCSDPGIGSSGWDSGCSFAAERYCCDVGRRKTCDNAHVDHGTLHRTNDRT